MNLIIKSVSGVGTNLETEGVWSGLYKFSWQTSATAFDYFIFKMYLIKFVFVNFFCLLGFGFFAPSSVLFQVFIVIIIFLFLLVLFERSAAIV